LFFVTIIFGDGTELQFGEGAGVAGTYDGDLTSGCGGGCGGWFGGWCYGCHIFVCIIIMVAVEVSVVYYNQSWLLGLFELRYF